LCGISSDIKALEVDHITPKNWNGADEIHNFQALCYTCNTNKRDTDDTDFRDRGKIFEIRENYCLFCNTDREKVAENSLAYVIKDAYPVSEGHALIIPKRHFDSYFDIKQPELNAVQSLLSETQKQITQSDNSVTGFNIGINQGKDAGQTIFHCHIHLIPRRAGDVENPRGGIRHLIPGKGGY
jgi:diadenosine tetraphosphate (Ap4A) HIT family hydrolase